MIVMRHGPIQMDEYEEIVNTLVNKWKKFLIDKYYYECFNMKDIDKKMTLDEAIQHCHEVAESCENKECALNHEQLANWLEELKCFKSVMADRDNSI